MNLLEAQGGGVGYIETFPNELIFLNKIIGDQTTKEQLKSVQDFLYERAEVSMNDMIDACYMMGDDIGVKNDKELERFKDRMDLLLMEIQFPLGAIPKEPRGAGSCPLV